MKFTHFSLLLFFVTLGIVNVSLANFGLRFEDNTDKHDAELRLRRDLELTKYNYTRVPPPHNSTSPVTINIGLHLIIISGLDALTQTLTTEMWLSLVWQDKRVSWVPSKYENITELRVPPHQLWQPDIKLFNAAKMSQISAQGYVHALVYNDGMIYWIPPSTFFSICEVNLKYYPYDVHTCTLKFASWTMSGEDIDLQLIQGYHLSLEEAYNDGGEWEAVSSNGVYSNTFYDCCTTPFPDVTFTLVVRRRSPLYKLAILCPILASIGIALAAFCLSPVSQIRITLNALALLLLVLELTHLSSKLPPVGSSPPVIVSLCGTVVILVAISTLLTASTLSFLRNRVNVRSVPQYVKTFVGWKPIQMIGSHGGLMFGPLKYSQEEEKLDVTDAENPFDGDPSSAKNGNYEEWLSFFQIVDRIAFAIFLFITILMLIVMSV